MQNSVVAPTAHRPLEVDIDDALYNRIIDRCTREGITPDDLINHLLREYVAVGDGTAPEPTLGCHRPAYSLEEYVAYRSSNHPIIAELEDFRAFAQGQGALSMSEWIGIWNVFCDDLKKAQDPSALYTLNAYVRARKLRGDPINEGREVFHAFCNEVRQLTVRQWDDRWDEFTCADAKDEADTQADALR